MNMFTNLTDQLKEVLENDYNQRAQIQMDKDGDKSVDMIGRTENGDV